MIATRNVVIIKRGITLITASLPCRVRKQKERYAVTELRKQQNRMNFGELSEDMYQGPIV